MEYECASEWLPLFLAAATLPSSHPLKQQTADHAQAEVKLSYEGAAEDLPLAGDDLAAYWETVAVLRGAAEFVAVTLSTHPEALDALIRP